MEHKTDAVIRKWMTCFRLRLPLQAIASATDNTDLFVFFPLFFSSSRRGRSLGRRFGAFASHEAFSFIGGHGAPFAGETPDKSTGGGTATKKGSLYAFTAVQGKAAGPFEVRKEERRKTCCWSALILSATHRALTSEPFRMRRHLLPNHRTDLIIHEEIEIGE